jgi:predicted thioesterase
MIYMVGVKVQTIRHVTVEAATIEEAEELGLKEAMALVGGIDGTVLEVYSNPRQLVGETERACLEFAQEYLGEENDAD